MEDEYRQERNLSQCEKLIMKIIWDAEADLCLSELIEELKRRYQKDYVRTTVATFLLHLSEKGYVVNYRKGRLSYIHALKSEEEYKEKMLRETTDFWFAGEVTELLTALCKAKDMTKEDVDKLKKALDDMDY